MKQTDYKPKSQPDTIIRTNLDDGKYATISNKIMMDTNLTSDAFRFIMILLNNSKEWEIQVGFFAKKLGWDRKKTAKVLANLEENHYLSKKKIPLGRHKGFEYIYTISEFGDLEEEISTEMEEDSIQLEISQPEPSKQEKEIFILDNGIEVEIPIEFYDYWLTIKHIPNYIKKLATNKYAALFCINLEELYNQSSYKLKSNLNEII